MSRIRNIALASRTIQILCLLVAALIVAVFTAGTKSEAFVLRAALFVSCGVAGYYGIRGRRRTDPRLERILSEARQSSEFAQRLSEESNHVAGGSRAHADRLEATSSSLEEIYNATRQNADHAREAEQLMDSTLNLVSRGLNSMDRMTRAIQDIKKSSDDTAKIVSTIDDIAFQTSLLSLNAAIEAARAGNAGQGFGVVAEEVRELSQRSAQAARSTSDLILLSIETAEAGVKVAEEAHEALAEITSGVRRLGQILSKITDGNEEQTTVISGLDEALREIGEGIKVGSSTGQKQAGELTGQLQHRLESVTKTAQAICAD
ncbi:MAG: methyl-accepting chemotaxis protein [Planctomycetota bacterium]